MSDSLPDLELGIAASEFDGRPKLVGRVGTEQVLVVKSGNEYFAVSALCTHYHGPLVEGLLVDGTIRCPWHHACFDLKTGAVKRGPALDPLERWQVDQQDGRIFVRRQLPHTGNAPYSADMQPESIVIVGTGAAGLASSGRNIGVVFGIAVLGVIVNGRVPAMLAPGEGVSDAALSAFRNLYVDALQAAYVVAAAVAFVGAVVAALTMRPTPPGTSAPVA